MSFFIYSIFNNYGSLEINTFSLGIQTRCNVKLQSYEGKLIKSNPIRIIELSKIQVSITFLQNTLVFLEI